MRKNNEQDLPKVAMLLDIDHFYGESEGRLGPIIIFLCIGLAPVLLYLYFGLYYFVPLWLFIQFNIIWFIRWAMIIPGDEKTRLANFKKQLNDVYAAMYELLRIRMIHPDGCIEYLNGEVAYMVVTYNATSSDDVKRSMQIRKFQSIMLDDRSYDINVQNITTMDALENRYEKVQFFTDAEVAQDFIDIIDHNINIVQTSSLLTRTIYYIKGRRSDWKIMSESIDAAINSNHAKVFKSVYKVTSKDEIEKILSRDVYGVVRFDDMIMKKYCTKEYHKSHVICYDDVDTTNSIEEIREDEGFHILFREEEIDESSNT